MTPSMLDNVSAGLAGIGWPTLIEGPAATVLALSQQLQHSQWFAPEILQAKQFEQLGQLAPWLARHSPAFAARLADAGLTAEDLANADGFAALPPVDRCWYQQGEGVNCGAIPTGHEPVGTNVTSGSTGEFIRIQRTRACQLLWLAMVLRDHLWRDTDFTLPLATARAPNPEIREFPNWGPPVTLLFDTGPALSLPVKLTGDELFDRLAAFGAGNLVIYPNVLRTVVAVAEARGAKLESLRVIRTVGEAVDDDLRERTRAALGLEIADAYTCQEAGYIALQCPESGLYHSMSETLIVEVLRADGTPCGVGETGKVVITDLHNYATPIVRYALGDVAEVGEPCCCGRGLPTIKRIIGRSRNLILLPDGNRVWPSLGGFGPDGYLQHLPINQFQVRQVEPDLLEIRLVTQRPLTSEEEQLIVERTLHSLEHKFRISFHYFEGKLPAPDSGKFEDFICLV